MSHNASCIPCNKNTQMPKLNLVRNESKFHVLSERSMHVVMVTESNFQFQFTKLLNSILNTVITTKYNTAIQAHPQHRALGRIRPNKSITNINKTNMVQYAPILTRLTQTENQIKARV